MFSRLDYSEIDPALRLTARLLPKGYALHRGVTVSRTVLGLAGQVVRLPGVPTAAVNADVSVRLHRPNWLTEPAPALLWMHGGGTVTGSAAQEDRFCRRLANFTDVAVVSVDYRLAPEHPYPTPPEDCYAALAWLARQPWVDPARIAVGGLSAGGGLAATVTRLARDRGDVAIVTQILVYPMLDDRTGADGDDRARVMWTASDNQVAWQWYLDGADPAGVAPARNPDLTGLPPAWIGVGTLDLFYAECLAYGRRLRDAGVPSHEEIAVGAYHTFDLFASRAPIAQRFFASQCRHLRAALVDGQ